MRMLRDLLLTFGWLFILCFALSVYADWRGSFDEVERTVAEWRAYPNDL